LFSMPFSVAQKERQYKPRLPPGHRERRFLDRIPSPSPSSHSPPRTIRPTVRGGNGQLPFPSRLSSPFHKAHNYSLYMWPPTCSVGVRRRPEC
jgi:hypothetical protein